MAIRLEAEAETQWITTKNLFGRLQLLNIDKKIWPIIIAECGQILQEMANTWPFDSRTIWDVWTHSPLGILIPSTITINITHCSNHHVQLWGIIHNSPEHSRTPSTTKQWSSTTSNSSTLYASSSPFWLSSWLTMPLSASPRAHLCRRKQFRWIRWEPQIICSLNTNHWSMMHITNTIWTRRTCTSGNMNWDSLCGTSIYVGSGISELGWG